MVEQNWEIVDGQIYFKILLASHGAAGDNGSFTVFLTKAQKWLNSVTHREAQVTHREATRKVLVH